MSETTFTLSEVEQSCENIAYNLRCGACAEIFFCGYTASPHEPDCGQQERGLLLARLKRLGRVPQECERHGVKNCAEDLCARLDFEAGLREGAAGSGAIIERLTAERDELQRRVLAAEDLRNAAQEKARLKESERDAYEAQLHKVAAERDHFKRLAETTEERARDLTAALQGVSLVGQEAEALKALEVWLTAIDMTRGARR